MTTPASATNVATTTAPLPGVASWMPHPTPAFAAAFTPAAEPAIAAAAAAAAAASPSYQAIFSAPAAQ
jgi:hypothetical protein